MAAYEFTQTRSPSSLKFNGVALTSYASRSSADSAGRGWVDECTASSRIYLVLNGGDTPYNGVLLAIIPYRFSTIPKAFTTGANANKFYSGRIQSLPNLSTRIERKFSGVAQIGSGGLTLNNSDGYFNGLADLNWDAGETVIKMGVDVPDSAMTYADYETLGTFFNGQHGIDEDTFTLGLGEKKINLRKKIPTTFFSTATYPNMKTQDIGKAIPLAYGEIYSAPAVCTNTVTREFTLASHAVYAIDAVRHETSPGVWESLTFVGTASTATFIAGSEWNGTDAVACDFRGRKSGSLLMENAADIVTDILAQIGETNISTASFTTARAALKSGTDRYDAEIHIRKPFLYINSATEALSVLSEINQAVGSYLYADAAGQFYYKVFEIQAGADLIHYTRADILSFSVDVDSEEIYSKVVAGYGRREAEDWESVYTLADTDIEYKHGQLGAKTKEITLPLGTTAEATAWAERFLINEGNPVVTYRIGLPWKGHLATPGTQVRITYADNSNAIEGVFEVLEQVRDLDAATVTLVLGDLHGFKTSGYWVGDATVFPDSLGGGSTAAWDATWTAAQKAWARENVGYWTDDNGLASVADPDSLNLSKWT